MSEKTHQPTWGLLGPENLPSLRRTQTLNLGKTIRKFNDLAVPGLGGVWFAKQLYLATLGVLVAKKAKEKGGKVSNIQVSNAIEALACLFAYQQNKWEGDPRLKGVQKLSTFNTDLNLSFKTASQTNFYVTQPMRMATVQALPSLKLVDSVSDRFNQFSCNEQTESFLNSASQDYKPNNMTVVDYLVNWVMDKKNSAVLNSGKLSKALSPLYALNKDAINYLRNALNNSSDSDRRKNALTWVDAMSKESNLTLNLNIKPKCINDDHWDDIVAGAKFFKVRDLALELLSKIESHIRNLSGEQALNLDQSLSSDFEEHTKELRKAAKEFNDTYEKDAEAKQFCDECQREAALMIKALVERDLQILKMNCNKVIPGPIFEVKAPEKDKSNKKSKLPIPEGVSYRLRNLYLLNLDLNSELDSWLKTNSKEEDDES